MSYLYKATYKNKTVYVFKEVLDAFNYVLISYTPERKKMMKVNAIDINL